MWKHDPTGTTTLTLHQLNRLLVGGLVCLIPAPLGTPELPGGASCQDKLALQPGLRFQVGEDVEAKSAQPVGEEVVFAVVKMFETSPPPPASVLRKEVLG